MRVALYQAMENSTTVEGYKKLLEAAKDETGLDDFGPDSFREGLEILVNALRREARLNALGEKVLRERIGEMREQVYHSEAPAFRDGLKAAKEDLRALLDKLTRFASDTPTARTA